MDDKDMLLHLKHAELQCEFILQANLNLDRSVKQMQDWSEDWDYQRRGCEDIYDTIHLMLIHYHQLSRIFWPAKCCGEQGLDLCHRAMALRSEINLPDLNHPLRDEKVWRHATEFDHSVAGSDGRRYSAHHLTSFNQVITWMDNEAMLCWFEPATRAFVFHEEEFLLPDIVDVVTRLQKDVQCYLRLKTGLGFVGSDPVSLTSVSSGHSSTAAVATVSPAELTQYDALKMNDRLYS